MVSENREKDVTNILIVDDLEVNRFTLRDIIADMGHRPILAESGEQALKLIQHFSIQLIISDIAMPGMDGFEFCRKVKDNPDTREIPIIFISAFDNPDDMIRGYALEGEDYITKPFIPEVIRARIKVHLKLSEAKASLVEMNRKLQVLVSEQIKQMEAEKRNVLYALLRVARETANYDENHMERLCYNSRILAEAMQLSTRYGEVISDGFIDTLELAAPLCDIGNVAVPCEIFHKKSALTVEEEKVMRKHTTIGAKILRDINQAGEYNDFIQMSVDIANYHHENWDGTGYPEGMKGEEIPLSAQIVALVSEYCALMEERTYRGMYDKESAFQIMQQEVGIKFSPDMFYVLKKIYKQLR